MIDVAAILDHVDHFSRRVVIEACRDADSAQWLRRAETLEAARPKVGDWHGRATPEELRERYDRLTEEAQACRNRARVSAIGGAWPEIDEVAS